MSLTISNQLFGKLEARMEDLREAVSEEDMSSIQKAVERVNKAFVEIRGTASVASTEVSELPTKTKKSRKAKSSDDAEKVKVEPKEGTWAWNVKYTLPNLYDQLKKDSSEKLPSMLKIGGYLNSQKMEFTLENMREATKVILENPEYQSNTQKVRSASNSTDEAPKSRGRPKKTAEKDEKPVQSQVKPTEIMAKLEAVLADEDDDDESDDEVDEDVPLSTFEYKGNNYLKDPSDEVYTSEGKMEWVGTFNGRKIIKGEMPMRVKKFIQSQE